MKDHGISLKPLRQGGPPVWVAGLVEAAVQRAAQIGDAWLIANATTLGATEPLMQVYRAALKESGRFVEDFPIARECYVGSSHATAMEECRAALEYKYNSYAAWGMESPTASMTFEQMAHDRFIIGDKVSVKEEIARWKERLGVNHFIMRVPVAGPGAGKGAEFDPAAWGDVRVGLEAGVPQLRPGLLRRCAPRNNLVRTTP